MTNLAKDREHLPGVLQHPASRRAVSDADLAERIKAIHAESNGTYGAPRTHAALRRGSVACGRKRVSRLMTRAGLVSPTSATGPARTHHPPGPAGVWRLAGAVLDP